MSKRTSAVAAAVLLAAAVLNGCAGEPLHDRFRWNEMIQSVTLAKQRSAAPVYLDVIRAMPIEWEKFYMFPPYTPIEDVQKALGFKWKGAAKTRIDERDDVTLLLFVAGQTVVDHIEHPRNKGDFSRLRAGHPYDARRAYFEVVEDTRDGQPWFYLVDARRNR